MKLAGLLDPVIPIGFWVSLIRHSGWVRLFCDVSTVAPEMVLIIIRVWGEGSTDALSSELALQVGGKRQRYEWLWLVGKALR